MNLNLQNKINQKLNINLGELIEQSFTTYKKTVITMALYVVLISVVFFVIYAIILSNFVNLDNPKAVQRELLKLMQNKTNLMIINVVSLLIGSVLAPLTAGLVKINHLAHQNQPFSFGTIFSYFTGKYTLNLMLSALAIGALGITLNMAIEPLGINWLTILLSLFTGFCFFNSTCLIIFDNANVADSMLGSIKLFFAYPGEIIVLILFAIVFAILGIFGLCIGIFATIGYLFTIKYHVYNAMMPTNKTDLINEIGLKDQN